MLPKKMAKQVILDTFGPNLAKGQKEKILATNAEGEIFFVPSAESPLIPKYAKNTILSGDSEISWVCMTT